MAQGNSIKNWLEKLGLTQEELAERLYETAWTVKRWEGDSPAEAEKMKQVDALLQTAEDTLREEGLTRWHLSDAFFSVESMYTRLKTLAQVENLRETYRALPYMREKHASQLRKPVAGSSEGTPYIIHPLMMTCQAHALGIRDDEVLATSLLHDVCEDCGVAPGDLPFSSGVQEAVALLTRDKSRRRAIGKEAAEEEYFHALEGSRNAMLVKCLDRCQNLSTMAGSFSMSGMRHYIEETERFVLPLLERLSAGYPELNDAAFLLKYQMLSLLETQKALLIRCPAENRPKGEAEDDRG